MKHPGEQITGDLSAWFDEHPGDSGQPGGHDQNIFPNGVGQLIFVCYDCMVLCGDNDIQAGNPIPVKQEDS